MARVFIFSTAVFSSILLASLVCPSSYASLYTFHCSNGSHSHGHVSSLNADSSFQTSLIDAFSGLISAASASKSHNSTVGGLGYPKIRTSFHCSRGIQLKECKRCVESTTTAISNLCRGRGHQNGIIWSRDCTLRYVNIAFPVEEVDPETPWAWWYSRSRIDEITDPAQFQEALASVVESLIDKATGSQSYATGEVFVTILDTLYATVECSPSISPDACRDCLRVAVARTASCCGGSRVAEVLLPSCRLGYDLGPSLSRATLIGPFTSSSSSIVTRSIANSDKKQHYKMH